MSILKCPVCQGELNRVEKSYRCKNNHTFDMGKQGYVNLHMSNEKRSKRQTPVTMNMYAILEITISFRKVVVFELCILKHLTRNYPISLFVSSESLMGLRQEHFDS